MYLYFWNKSYPSILFPVKSNKNYLYCTCICVFVFFIKRHCIYICICVFVGVDEDIVILQNAGTFFPVESGAPDIRALRTGLVVTVSLLSNQQPGDTSLNVTYRHKAQSTTDTMYIGLKILPYKNIIQPTAWRHLPNIYT